MMSRMMSTDSNTPPRAANGVTSRGTARKKNKTRQVRKEVVGRWVRRLLADTGGAPPPNLLRLTLHGDLDGAVLLPHVVACRAPVDAYVVPGEVPQGHDLGVLEICSGGREEGIKRGFFFPPPAALF